METVSHVLAHKTDRHLFVVLTSTRRGRRNRRQWHYTEDLREATGFADIHEAERRQREHGVPPLAAIPREYTVAHGDWLRALEFPPEKRERQGDLFSQG